MSRLSRLVDQGLPPEHYQRSIPLWSQGESLTLHGNTSCPALHRGRGIIQRIVVAPLDAQGLCTCWSDAYHREKDPALQEALLWYLWAVGLTEITAQTQDVLTEFDHYLQVCQGQKRLRGMLRRQGEEGAPLPPSLTDWTQRVQDENSQVLQRLTEIIRGETFRQEIQAWALAHSGDTSVELTWGVFRRWDRHRGEQERRRYQEILASWAYRREGNWTLVLAPRQVVVALLSPRHQDLTAHQDSDTPDVVDVAMTLWRSTGSPQLFGSLEHVFDAARKV